MSHHDIGASQWETSCLGRNGRKMKKQKYDWAVEIGLSPLLQVLRALAAETDRGNLERDDQ